MASYVKVYTLPSGTQASIVPLAVPDHYAIHAHHVVLTSASIIHHGQRRRWRCASCADTFKHGYDLAVHAVGVHLRQARHFAGVVALPTLHIPIPHPARVMVDPYLAHAQHEAIPSGSVSIQTMQSWLTVKQLPGINHPRTLPSWCRCALLALLARRLVAFPVAA